MQFRLKKELTNEILILTSGFICYFLVISLYVESLSNFISDVGVNMLPIVLLVRSLLFGIFTIIFVGISSRFRQQRIFAVLVLIFALSFAVLPHLEKGSWFLTVYFYFVTSLFFTFLDVGLILFATNFVNPIRAKTFLPLLSSVASIGLIAGSYFSANFNHLNSETGYGYIPATLLVLVATMMSSLRKPHGLPSPQNIQKVHHGNFKKMIAQSLEYVFKTSLFRYLAIGTVLFICLQFFVEFKQNTVLMQSILPEDLNTVLGKIFFAENMLRLAVSVFFVKKILFRFGVLNTMMLFAVVVLLSVVSAFLLGWNVAGVVLVYLVFSVSYVTLYQVASSQSVAFLPEHFVQGVSYIFNQLSVAVASVLASCFLLLYSYNLGLERYINTGFITVIAVVGMALIFKLRKSYQGKLQENVASENGYLQKKVIALLAEKAQKNKGENLLRKLLSKHDLSKDMKEDVIYSLSIIGNPQTVADLIQCLDDTSDKVKFATLRAIHHMLRYHRILKKYPFTKHQLLEAYENIFISNVSNYIKQEVMNTLKYFEIEDIIQFLEKNLRNDDNNVVMYTLETLSNFNDRSIVHYLKPFLENQNPHLRSSAIVGMWKFSDYRPLLLQKIGEILKCKTQDDEECAVFLIDHLDLYWEKDLLRKIVEKNNDKSALYALITLIKLGETNYIEKLLAEMSELERKNEKSKLELLLSKYRSLNRKTKNAILKKIDRMPYERIQDFYQSFATSRYIFKKELEALGPD